MKKILKSIKKTGGMFWIVVLLNILILSITLGLYRYCALSLYQYGVNPDPARLIIEKVSLFAILYFVIVFSAFITIVVLIIMQAIYKKFLFVIVGVCLVFISTFYVFFSYNNRKPGIYYIFQGAVNRTKQNLNYDDIREWANNIDSLSKYDEWPGIPKIKWSPAIYNLKPNTVFVKKVDKSNIKILLEWGGAPMGHWGLIIGPKTMEIPKSDIRQNDEYRCKIEDGVYAWCEIRSTKFLWSETDM